MDKFDLSKAREKLGWRMNPEYLHSSANIGYLALDILNEIINALDPPIEPPFQWSMVKPGMAFRYTFDNSTWYYACPSVKYPNDVAVVTDCNSRYWPIRHEQLVRAPEHDKP